MSSIRQLRQLTRQTAWALLLMDCALPYVSQRSDHTATSPTLPRRLRPPVTKYRRAPVRVIFSPPKRIGFTRYDALRERETFRVVNDGVLERHVLAVVQTDHSAAELSTKLRTLEINRHSLNVLEVD